MRIKNNTSHDIHLNPVQVRIVYPNLCLPAGKTTEFPDPVYPEVQETLDELQSRGVLTYQDIPNPPAVILCNLTDEMIVVAEGVTLRPHETNKRVLERDMYSNPLAIFQLAAEGKINITVPIGP